MPTPQVSPVLPTCERFNKCAHRTDDAVEESLALLGAGELGVADAAVVGALVHVRAEVQAAHDDVRALRNRNH